MTIVTLPFRKLDGAGNDFVLLESPSPVPGVEQIRSWLDRHHGIGGDGFLYLEREGGQGGGDAVVRYWNADGSRAEYCGNGARCIAAVLLEDRPPDASVRFRLSDVEVRARREGEPGRYAVAHPRPEHLPVAERILALADELGLDAPPVAVRAGVPHLLLSVRDGHRFDLARFGPQLRRHPAFAPDGTNVDVFWTDGEAGSVHVRTWERGVEGETRACGSGLLAVGFWLRARGREVPIELVSAGGARFRVWDDEEGFWLSGPARVAFRGQIELLSALGSDEPGTEPPNAAR